MSRLEHLRPGNFVVVVGCRNLAAYAAYNPYREEYEPLQFPGVPLRIVELGLPFACVTDGQKTFAIDLRDFDVQKVGGKYAAAMAGYCTDPRQAEQKRTALLGQAAPPAAADPKVCPRCGQRMVERRTAGIQGWFLTCSTCGHNGGPVLVATP
ncbi:MAG TPA: hypothetical protein VFB80_11640 [Pirellulaceae bacterium]|nr:hypothetical protein [Pirellulaceae bacterium]